MVSNNVTQGGLSLDRAIFDPRRGAILYYPSALISTSMRILTQSVKKGLKIAARSLMSISEYVSNIKKINDRLKLLCTKDYFTNDLKYLIVRTIYNGNKQKFNKLMMQPEIIKMTMQ